MKRYIIQKETGKKKAATVHLSLPNYNGKPDKYLLTTVFVFKNQALTFIENEKLEGFKVITVNI